MKNLSLLATVFLLSIGLVGCGEKTQQGDDTVVVTTEDTENTGSGTLFSDFDKDDYRLTITAAGLSEAEMAQMGDMTVEFDADTTYLRVTGEMMGQTMEIIEAGDDIYTNMAGTWMKVPGGKTKDEKNMMTKTELEKWMKSPMVKSAGEEACGDKTCEVYVEQVEDMETKLYMDDQNRPYKVIATVGSGASTTIMYDYDAEISITIPEGVEDFEMPDPAAIEAMMQEQEGAE